MEPVGKSADKFSSWSSLLRTSSWAARARVLMTCIYRIGSLSPESESTNMPRSKQALTGLVHFFTSEIGHLKYVEIDNRATCIKSLDSLRGKDFVLRRTLRANSRR